MKFNLVTQIVVVILVGILTTSSTNLKIQGIWISRDGTMKLEITTQNISFKINDLDPIIKDAMSKMPYGAELAKLCNRDLTSTYKMLPGNKIKIDAFYPDSKLAPEICKFEINRDQISFTSDNSILADPWFSPWKRYDK